ncbi:hypothetical protein LTR36_000995 [Oleoguttula mirabilis]|uniref:DNA replication ATP-dependent helicase/nuclease DNA2 n=1 Tax=Oleoguttula mirabilis TaxID=1507867 RepID=A0AAV9JPJ6_9PEZI|nr:hypothetical protein LTR36_000995 [Oleoguttula mirabilis]
MAHRTKSFFDQDHKAKQRPGQWHRRDPTKPVLGEKDANALPPRPPIPPTSQAKSKLKAFQFIPGQPEQARSEGPPERTEDAQIAEKESANVGTAKMGGGSTANGASSAPQRPSEAATSSHSTTAKTPQLPHAHTFPCTPGARLPLEDLIGNFDEDARRPEPKEQSPEEQIGWIPNSSSTLLTPRRKRKRARSSSPSCPTTSSQRQETSAFFAGNGTQGEKKTPEADPTADLWLRYGAGKDVGDSLKLPDFSHLMAQASPRPLETPVKSGGLRRWASTGNDWPSSKNKRRRTDARSSISLWQDGQQTESGGKSTVATMVEKIQETLATQRLAQSVSKPAVTVEAPSSSGTLPEEKTESSGNPPIASPLEAKQTSAPRAGASQVVVQQQPPEPARPAQAAMSRPSRAPIPPYKAIAVNVPSDGPAHAANTMAQQQFSDVVQPAPLHLQSKAPLPAYRRPAMMKTSSASGRLYPTKQPSQPAPAPALPVVNEDFDEFGDAFDLSAEDLDELVSQKPLNQRSLYEIPAHPNPPPQQSLLVDENAATRPSQVVIDVDEDEFGDDDLDEDALVEAEFSATQAHRASHTSSNNVGSRSPRKTRSPQKSSQVQPSEDMPGKLQRYKVKEVVDGEYTNSRGRPCPERLLMAEDERTKSMIAITLRDSWAMTSVSAGNIVHIAHLRHAEPELAASASPPGQVFISDAPHSASLIVHPDHMISATTVADSFDCIRKAVLQDRIKATGESSKPMIYGKILHEIFQQALSANRWDSVFLADLVEKTVGSHVEGLWELGMKDTVLAVEEITAKMSELAAWAKVFVASKPSEASLVDDKQGEKVWMSVSKLIAIEEHVWSPRFGLKGNIDATVQSTIIDHPKEAAKKLIAPFEVKTGRTTQSPAHRAQTALYTLLLSDRYDVAVQAGILYYLESSTISRIAPPINEIRQMVQQRNRLAAYIHRAKHPRMGDGKDEASAVQTQEIEESGLPTLLKNPFKCGRCYAQQSCFTYHALVEQGTADSAGMIDDGKKNHSLVWHEAVGHLALSAKNQTDAAALKAWFAKWDKLLTFEESETSRYKKELWTMPSAEREAAGRCFGNLVLDQDSSTASGTAQTVVDGIEGSGGKINRFTYVFKRAKVMPRASFAEGTQLTVGEPVVVSSESGQWALANGYVLASTKHDITVAVDRRLGNARQRLDGFDDARNHAFQGIMTVGKDTAATDSAHERVLYRLDKDEFSNGLALIRNNLVNLMSSHPINTKLRQQVVFGTKPLFASPSQPPAMPPSQLGDMNEDQRAAVGKVLSAQDYALILGMPGTGKTTTIAHIIRALLADNKTIMLTSFTHTAVDNILLKIRDIAPPNSILRLGVPAKINPEVQQFCQLAATPRQTIDEIEAAYMGCRIVATTCMGTNHAVFGRRAFDVCIVDEASQITLPTALGPLLHARRFVLVGDHYQLPPLVQNRVALEGGLDVSLFRQLSEEHPEAVATLGKQYRMCEDIMSLSNELIYSGQLRCGNDEVAKRTLSIQSVVPLRDFHRGIGASQGCHGQCWVGDVVRPERKVVFANTDAIGKGAVESLTSGKNITNQVEATLSAQLVLSLLKLGVSGRDIGVITLYRSQLALMRQLFKLAGIGSEVEIDSADRFQGRDKECIILSMVRSNEAGIVGDLLKDWRRVNVALTRARSKLIVLGSRRTLVNNELLARFLNLVDRRGWAMDLPKGADTCHTFDFSSQSVAGGMAARSTPIPSKKIPRSPSKQSRTSPLKMQSASPSRVLKPSASAGNRSPSKYGSSGRAGRVPGKVIKGQTTRNKMRSNVMKEQLAMGIFEDLTAEDF